MAQIAPPPPPIRVTLADDDSFRRLQTRIWLVWMTLLTILVTAWFCTLGVLSAIIALVVAKHILVALLVMALEEEARHEGTI
jgi:caa(3)-type oxidase subunit IV